MVRRADRSGNPGSRRRAGRRGAMWGAGWGGLLPVRVHDRAADHSRYHPVVSSDPALARTERRGRCERRPWAAIEVTGRAARQPSSRASSPRIRIHFASSAHRTGLESVQAAVRPRSDRPHAPVASWTYLCFGRFSSRVRTSTSARVIHGLPRIHRGRDSRTDPAGGSSSSRSGSPTDIPDPVRPGGHRGLQQLVVLGSRRFEPGRESEYIVGSERSQIRRLPHASSPWDSPTAS